MREQKIEYRHDTEEAYAKYIAEMSNKHRTKYTKPIVAASITFT
jgi:hypothetical protein